MCACVLTDAVSDELRLIRKGCRSQGKGALAGAGPSVFSILSVLQGGSPQRLAEPLLSQRTSSTRWKNTQQLR